MKEDFSGLNLAERLGSLAGWLRVALKPPEAHVRRPQAWDLAFVHGSRRSPAFLMEQLSCTNSSPYLTKPSTRPALRMPCVLHPVLGSTERALAVGACV